MSATAVAASSRIAEEISVWRNACNGCTTLRGKRRLDRDHVGRRPSEGRESRRVRSGRSWHPCRPVFPAHLQNFSILLLLRGARARVAFTRFGHQHGPLSVTPNRVQRGASKKRRLPLALLIVPIVLVGIGVAIF